MAADERIHGEVLRGLAARGRVRLSGRFERLSSAPTTAWSATWPWYWNWGYRCRRTNDLVHRSCGLLAGALSMGAGEYVRYGLSASCSDRPARPGVAIGVAALVVDANDSRWSTARGCGHRRQRSMRVRVGHAAPGRRPTEAAGVDPHEAVRLCLAGGSLQLLLSLLPEPWCGVAVSVRSFRLAAVRDRRRCCVGIALLGTGAVVGLLSGTSPLKRALRQLGIGYGARGHVPAGSRLVHHRLSLKPPTVQSSVPDGAAPQTHDSTAPHHQVHEDRAIATVALAAAVSGPVSDSMRTTTATTVQPSERGVRRPFQQARRAQPSRTRAGSQPPHCRARPAGRHRHRDGRAGQYRTTGTATSQARRLPLRLQQLSRARSQQPPMVGPTVSWRGCSVHLRDSPFRLARGGQQRDGSIMVNYAHKIMRI